MYVSLINVVFRFPLDKSPKVGTDIKLVTLYQLPIFPKASSPLSPSLAVRFPRPLPETSENRTTAKERDSTLPEGFLPSVSCRDTPSHHFHQSVIPLPESSLFPHRGSLKTNHPSFILRGRFLEDFWLQASFN